MHACRKLLRDIEDVRTSKIRKGTRMVMDEVKKRDHVHDVSSLINFRNLTFTELNNTRPTLTMALDTLADINPRAVSTRLQPVWRGLVASPVLTDVLLPVLKPQAAAGGQALGGGEEPPEDEKPAEGGPRRKLRRYR